MMAYKLKRSFNKLKGLIEETLGVNNEVAVEYEEEKQVMNVEVNECGFQAHFSYGDLEEGVGDEYLFIFDRGVHPVIIAHLVNLGNEVFGNIHILDPYFIMNNERYTGMEAEEMYTHWLASEIMENAIFSTDIKGETVH